MSISMCARLPGIVAVFAFSVFAPLGAQQPPPSPQAARPMLRSPEIHPDRTVTFRLLGAEGHRGHAERQLGRRHRSRR